MSSQGDLQNWLNQLKKRQSGGGGSQRPSQQMPSAPRHTSHSKPQQARRQKKVQSFDPDIMDVDSSNSGMSATDIALQKIRQQEEQERIAKKREALIKKQKAEKRLAQQKRQLEEAQKPASKVSRNKHKRRTVKVSDRRQPDHECRETVDFAGIHYNLRNNPSAKKEALIFSEIIMPPVAMREKRQFF